MSVFEKLGPLQSDPMPDLGGGSYGAAHWQCSDCGEVIKGCFFCDQCDATLCMNCWPNHKRKKHGAK
jgi:hypothetical protein